MDPRRFKAPFLRRTQIWEKADALHSWFPSCAILPVPVVDLAEFDLGLELVPKAHFKQAGDIEALLLGDPCTADHTRHTRTAPLQLHLV